MSLNGTFSGLRVVDFCWVGAGALVTKLLAEHGADVIKVESRERPDNLRVSPPFRPGREGLDGSGYFASRNNDKRSFALNMRNPKSRGIALRLVAGADVVTNNFRPGVMERWGLGYDEVRELNPSVVYLAMPMQGSSGPHRDYIGFGQTIAALGGLVELSGLPDRAPVGTGTQYPDHVPSPGHALVALLAAIRQRRATGRGRLIELSQFESTVNLVGPALLAASLGASITRTGNRVPGHSPSAVFRCTGEDNWCAVVARDDAEWRSLARTVGLDALGADPRFATLEQRKAHEDELEGLLAAAIGDRERWELTRALQAEGVPAWPVMSSPDLLADEHLRARGFWRTLNHPAIGEMTAPSAPFRIVGEGPTGPVEAAPLLGAHTREVASSVLGLDDAQIDELVAEKALW
ncbi:MAG TPA: CoA transferase [Gaiellaceae bacterium]